MSGPLPTSVLSKTDRAGGVQATITAATNNPGNRNIMNNDNGGCLKPLLIGSPTAPPACPQQGGIVPRSCTTLGVQNAQVKKNAFGQEMITIVSDTSCDKYVTQQDDVSSPDVKATCEYEQNSISITVSEVKKQRLLGNGGDHGSSTAMYEGNLGGKIQYRTLREELGVSGSVTSTAQPVQYVMLSGGSETTTTEAVSPSFEIGEHFSAGDSSTSSACGAVNSASPALGFSETSALEFCSSKTEQSPSIVEVTPASDGFGRDPLQFKITNTMSIGGNEPKESDVSSTCHHRQTVLKLDEKCSVFPEKQKSSVVPSTKRPQDESSSEILPNKRKIRLTAKALSYVKDSANLRGMYTDTEASGKQMVKRKGNRAKRSGLSLELKVDIIKRVNSGEKQSDVGDEYGVNIHTVKTIVKKSNVYLECWNKGAFNPETMRIKGAKREDLENVLYYWHQNSLESGSNLQITGSVMCAKAVELAKKLGYSDFKASHGWLDRFKKRKGIVFNRSFAKKLDDCSKNEENVKNVDPSPLGDALLYHDPSNVFTLLETGLFYKTLPCNSINLQSERCAGGIHGTERVSVLMCTNMTASEKFPLLVAGKMSKSTYRLLVKDSPVQYISDEDSWFTKESIFAWLLDLDDWFAQHRRKVMIILSNLPIHEQSKNHQFNALTLYQLPMSSMLPLQSNVLTSFKLNYRQALLIEFLNAKRRQQSSGLLSDPSNTTPKFPMSLYIGLFGVSWQNITEAEIIEGFQRAGISRYGGWGVNHSQDVLAKARPDVMKEYKALDSSLPPDYSWETYIHFDDKLQVCDEFSVDDMIAKVLGSKTMVESEVPPVTSSDECDSIDESLRVVQEFVEARGQTEMLQVFRHFQELLKSSAE